MRFSWICCLVLTLAPVAAALAAPQDACVQHGEHTAFTYLLIDRSDTFANREGFKQSLQSLQEMLIPGERLLAAVSTDKASQMRIVLDMVKPAESVWTSKLKSRSQERLFNECLAKLQNDMTSLEESYKRSALLETLSFASKVLNGDAAALKRLVVYSNMMQNSATVSFYSGKEFNPQLTLKQVEKEDLLWKFPAVAVYLAGIGGGISDELARRVEKFWQSYFEKSGAELKFYGPILIR